MSSGTSSVRRESTADPAAGARNLLVGCAGVRAGDQVLFIVEPEGSDHYAPELAPFLSDAARALGATVAVMPVAPGGGPESIPAPVLQAIAAADHTIFLNRIGDQLRFAPLPGKGTKTMSYALDLELLGSGFATTPFAVWEGIQARLSAELDAATGCTIRCPRGTELSMRFESTRPGRRNVGTFTVRNFPVMIVPPLAATGLSGRLVLSQALTSTYIHAYEDSILPLLTPVTLVLEQGAIVDIEGEPELVARVRRQFERVGGLFGGVTWAVNSWHAGINTFTSFSRPALSDIDRWSCVAFGSPRYAHFHMCGPLPGDICGQIFDPTITFDDRVLWKNGGAQFLDAADAEQLTVPLGWTPAAALARRDIGVAGI